MADKRITALDLRDNVSDEVNFPCDDTIQSYRVTAEQIKDYVNPMTDAGDLVVGGTDGEPERLAPGNAGDLLQMSGGAPVWAPVIPTGFGADFYGATAPAGWVLASGRTIGNGSSGGTERAHADTEALFTMLWNDYSNTLLPIQDSSGSASTRGASAAADYAANKRMPLPDLRGRVAVGKDNMGGSTASRITSAAVSVDGTVLGASGGTQTHTLTTAQIPSHNHSVSISGAGMSGSSEGFGAQATSIGGNTGNAGSGNAHPNVQPMWVTNKIIKL